VTFEITPLGQGTRPQGRAVRLTDRYDIFPADNKVYPGIRESWPAILSSLKSLSRNRTIAETDLSGVIRKNYSSTAGRGFARMYLSIRVGGEHFATAGPGQSVFARYHQFGDSHALVCFRRCCILQARLQIVTLDINHAKHYYERVIKTFKCKDTRALSNGERVRQFANFAAIARRKLRQLEIAAQLEDLRVPPGNRLEALKGDRIGQYSIRVNDQFRVCFRWTAAGAEDVEIVDYH
jgi:toxin HigB-1